MASCRFYPYFVVRFRENPFPEIATLECVPNHWLRTRNPDNLLVSYPSQFSPRIHERVRNNSDVLKTWKLYRVEVLHATDDVEGAEAYIQYKLNPWRNQPVQEIGREELLRSLKIKSHVPIKLTHRFSSTPAAEHTRENDMKRTSQTARLSSNTESHSKRRKNEEFITKDPSPTFLLDKIKYHIGNVNESIRKCITLMAELETTMNYVCENMNKLNVYFKVLDYSPNAKSASASTQPEDEHVIDCEEIIESDYESPSDYSDDVYENVEEEQLNATNHLQIDTKACDTKFNKTSTLKYRRTPCSTTNLYELGANVWVSKRKLTKCIADARDEESLTKILLQLVFKKKALGESISQKDIERANHDPNYAVVPKLDDRAMEVVAAFVRAQAEYKGWRMRSGSPKEN